MRGKTIWIIAIGLMGLSLLLASCAGTPTAAPTSAPAAGTTAPSAAVGTSTPPVAVGTQILAMPTGAATAPAKASAAASPAAGEKPQTGGVVNLAWPLAPLDFDQVVDSFYKINSTDLTHEMLIEGDWSVGPSGSNLTNFERAGVSSFVGTKACVLCDSWKLVEPGHYQFKIRKGVRFSLQQDSEASKLVNGREMTADDVVFSLNRFLQNNKYVKAAEPKLVQNAVITKLDNDTVDYKTVPETTLRSFTMNIWGTSIVPKEVVDKYGDLNDPKRQVGTGPFMLANYVSGSSLTYVKNPSYWMKDPVGPGQGNQLPYLDGVNILIITDASTRLTALRTGKIDEFGPLVKDDYDTLIKSSPQLKTLKEMGDGTNGVYMRVDKQDLPFKDVKVRQALAMAIDYKGIVNKLLGGDGEYPGFPTANIPDYKGIYFPLSELPADVQEIWNYNPTKAKQLLADAGYPDGFKTSLLINSTDSNAADYMSVFKDAWAKIGVDATLQPQENATYNATFTGRKYDQMAYGIYGSHGIYLGMLNWVGDTVYNGNWGLDPDTPKAKEAMTAAIAAGDLAKADATYKDLEKLEMGRVWTIPFPRSYAYYVWWPWVKNYHGEQSIGYLNVYRWPTWVWVDQSLKKSLGF